MKKRLHNIWAGMKQRCYNPKSPAYKNYGGRGITVCDDWLDFQPFYEWAITHRYRKKLTLDRIDNNGNYDPSNCRFVTRRKQANNTRKNVRYTICGITHTIAEWARIIKRPPSACSYGIKKHGINYIKDRLPERYKNRLELEKEVIMKRNRLKSLRALHGLNQDEMAERCGVSRGVYGLIEQGKVKGKPEFWIKLKSEFCLTAEEAWRIEYEN